MVFQFFCHVIEVNKDRATARFEVEDGITSGDYLHGFLRGTRAALYERDVNQSRFRSRGECAPSRRADCSLRTCGWVLWPLVNITLIINRRRSGKKGRDPPARLQCRARAMLPSEPGKTAEELLILSTPTRKMFITSAPHGADDPAVRMRTADKPSRKNSLLGNKSVFPCHPRRTPRREHNARRAVERRGAFVRQLSPICEIISMRSNCNRPSWPSWPDPELKASHHCAR